jgi:arylsulfatase A-like enzyme
MAGGGWTRRGILGAGAAGALGAGLGVRPRTAGAAPGRADGPNVVVIVLEGARADFVGAFEDPDKLARTPNLDALAADALRFERAFPESMPSVPARRALLTGERSFPFRDWKPTPGWPRTPGWSPIRASQPLLTSTLRQGGVTSAYVTDNPYLLGRNFAAARDDFDTFVALDSQASYRRFNTPITTPASAESAQRYVLPRLRATPAMEAMREYVAYNRLHRHAEADYSAARVFAEGMRQLERLGRAGKPFVLFVDAFEPTAPYDPPPSYRRRYSAKGVQNEGIDPIQPFADSAATLRQLDIDDGTRQAIRELYAAEMTFVDAWIGRLLDRLDALKLAGDTVVYFLSASGTMLGEHGIVGVYPPALHQAAYEIPYMIRDPAKRRGGERSTYYASTHDVAPTILGYLGLRAPGKMDGEDLTVLFAADESKRHPPPRDHFVLSIANMVVVGNEQWLLIADSEGHVKRLYHTDGDPRHAHEVGGVHPSTTRRLFQVAVRSAGGTLPRFGPDGAIRPAQPIDKNLDDDNNDNTNTNTAAAGAG